MKRVRRLTEKDIAQLDRIDQEIEQAMMPLLEKRRAFLAKAYERAIPITVAYVKEQVEATKEVKDGTSTDN